MIAAGRWDDVLVLTYSEFGRRARQNASGGTDHGTAAPHFVMGGKVKGGLHGAYPSLADLQDGDLRHTVDFRDVYSTIARGCWGQPVGFGQRQVATSGFHCGVTRAVIAVVFRPPTAHNRAPQGNELGRADISGQSHE